MTQSDSAFYSYKIIDSPTMECFISVGLKDGEVEFLYLWWQLFVSVPWFNPGHSLHVDGDENKIVL